MVENMPQNIILEGRKKLSVSGVCDIDSFNDLQINAITTLGALIIKGTELHISKLSVEKGELEVLGKVDSLVYTHVKQKGGMSVIKKIFS